METLLCGGREKRFTGDRYRRMFLDTNPVCFWEVVDYLNECKIVSNDSTPVNPHVGKEDNIFLQRLLLAFGLGDDRLVGSKKSHRKPKVRKNNAEIDAHSIASQDKWKTMMFNKFPIWKSYEIQTVLEKEQNALIFANDKLNHQRHLFEEEKNHLHFFTNNKTVDVVWLDLSGTLMSTKRSILGLYKDFVLAKRFDDPLWAQQDKTTSAKDWSCEEVAEWVTRIEGMSNGIFNTFLENNVNGAALLAIQEEFFKDDGVSKVGPLTLLLEEITHLHREKKPEAQAVFVDHNAYCFGKIIDSLPIRAMCENEETLPYYVYIQDTHQENFETIVDYLFPGESTSFILQGKGIDSTILSKHQSSRIKR